MNISEDWSNKWVQHVIDNPDKFFDSPYTWHVHNVIEQLKVTIDVVVDHNEICWDFNILSLNPNMTWEIVYNHPDKPWNHNLLTKMFNDKDAYFIKMLRLE